MPRLGSSLTQKERTIKWLKGEGFCNNCKYKAMLMLPDRGTMPVCVHRENSAAAFNADRLACDYWELGSEKKVNGTMDTYGSAQKAELTLDIEALKLYQKTGMKFSAMLPEVRGTTTSISIELKVQT
jgi:hypothetical protein